MNKERFTIKNRRGLKLVIQVDALEDPKNLVFIAHGQAGFMEQKHIQAFADAFLENDFRVVRFDATHSVGESEGDIKGVTYGSYINDLEDVINWARTQSWFQQPFALCGHSMGAQSTAWYAENHSDEVNLLAPIAAPVNYGLYIKTLTPRHSKEWKEKGYDERYSQSRPGKKFRIGWAVNESLKDYDLLPNADKLTMPVLLMAGEFDQPCPIKNQQILFNAMHSNDKTLVKIDGVDHNFRTPGSGEQKLSEIKGSISKWLHQ